MSTPEIRRGPIKSGSIGRTPPRKRFYKDVSLAPHEAGFVLLLDGRAAKTPAGKPLAVAKEAIANALVAEWAVQSERLDPAAMPLTRLVNAAIDGVAAEMEAVRGDIVKYAGSDLICYRAEDPEELVALQETHWDPLIAHVHEKHGARLSLIEGIMHVGQDRDALAAIAVALEGDDPLRLAAIHAVTTLTGSAVIALALADGLLTTEAAWAAAHIDEDWQMSQWGKDEIALERRALRWRETEAAGLVLACA